VNGPREGEAGADVSPTVRAIALEVSALGRRSHAATEFVAFARAALHDAEDLAVVEWSARRLRREDRPVARLRHAWRPRIAERVATLGLPVTTRWAVRNADVVFLAGGPLALRAKPPGVVTVLDPDPDAGGRDAASRRRLDQLRRAAGDGLVLHVPTHAAADVLATALAVDRASIAVAVPGVRAVAPADTMGSATQASILVLEGGHPSRDHAVLEALRAAGLDAALATSPSTSSPVACCVVASPDDAFPLVALEAIAAGHAVVAARTPATTELLEGAAALVDGNATQEFVEAAMALGASDAARTIGEAAGRARAQDFTWGSRSEELRVLVRRALLEA